MPVEYSDLDALKAQHSDIRFEQQEQASEIIKEGLKAQDRLSNQSGAEASEIIKEGLKGDYATLNAIKDSRYETVSRIESNADRIDSAVTGSHKDVMDRFFAVGRDTADLRAQVTGLGYQVRDGHASLSKDIELNSLKGMLEGQKNTQFLSDKISNDGEKTRALINDLKYGDLNRALIERNAELVEAVADGRHWRHHADQNQWAGQFSALQNQLQAFNSQLQETRQGMVNFGTMAGVGQTSTSNNVR